MYAIAYATNAALPNVRNNVMTEWKNFFIWMHLVLPIRPKMALMTRIGFMTRIDPLRAWHIRMPAGSRMSGKSCQGRDSVDGCDSRECSAGLFFVEAWLNSPSKKRRTFRSAVHNEVTSGDERSRPVGAA